MIAGVKEGRAGTGAARTADLVVLIPVTVGPVLKAPQDIVQVDAVRAALADPEVIPDLALEAHRGDIPDPQVISNVPKNRNPNLFTTKTPSHQGRQKNCPLSLKSFLGVLVPWW
jgi:hypothetical protein